MADGATAPERGGSFATDLPAEALGCEHDSVATMRSKETINLVIATSNDTDLALTGSDPHATKYISWREAPSGSESGAAPS